MKTKLRLDILAPHWDLDAFSAIVASHNSRKTNITMSDIASYIKCRLSQFQHHSTNQMIKGKGNEIYIYYKDVHCLTISEIETHELVMTKLTEPTEHDLIGNVEENSIRQYNLDPIN